MDREEYFELSNQKKLPIRCPILNYCTRRADTVYMFSDYERYHPNEDGIQVLQHDGVLPSDFMQKRIPVQGESTYLTKGSSSMYFSGACPEVNLFDGMNALISEVACVSGDYDKYYKEPKSRILKCQHYSECPEFSYYQFHQKKGSGKKRKSIPAKVKALLQQEINSSCPLCPNDDVGHFQIHHIDDDPQNNEMGNLLMLCPTCHSKITKGDISRDTVIELKVRLTDDTKK